MSDQIKECGECFGTGNEPRMRPIRPGHKLLFRPCPACRGTGKGTFERKA